MRMVEDVSGVICRQGLDRRYGYRNLPPPTRSSTDGRSCPDPSVCSPEGSMTTVAVTIRCNAYRVEASFAASPRVTVIIIATAYPVVVVSAAATCQARNNVTRHNHHRHRTTEQLVTGYMQEERRQQEPQPNAQISWMHRQRTAGTSVGKACGGLLCTRTVSTTLPSYPACPRANAELRSCLNWIHSPACNEWWRRGEREKSAAGGGNG